jgi:hypothetical protein
MDAYKIAGAVLSALLVIFGGRTVLDIAFKEKKPERPGWALPVTEPAAQTKQQAPAAFETHSRNVSSAIRPTPAGATSLARIFGVWWVASLARPRASPTPMP